MIIYKDMLTGDELFTDAYKIREIENGFIVEVEGKTITRTETFDDSKIGANPSAEELCDLNEASTQSGCDIVLNHSLQEMTFNKKTYQEHIKVYMKDLKHKLEQSKPDRLDPFLKGAGDQVKKILGNINNYQFFTGSSLNPEGMVGLLDYREDGITPYMIFFKDGLETEKC